MQVQVQVQVQVQAHLEYGEELLGDQLGVGPRQVDLVDDRQDGQVRREGEEKKLETVWACTPWLASTSSRTPWQARRLRVTS